MHLSSGAWHDLIWSGVVLVIAVLAALALHWASYAVGGRFAGRSRSVVDDSLIRHTRKPTRIVFPLLAIFVVLPALPIPPNLLDPARHILALAMIATLGWAAVALTEIVTDVAAERYPLDVPDNLGARRIRTQLQLLRRVTVIVVAVVALSLMLMTFPGIRQLGVSLFASAGIAGLVLGMAARPTISNLLSGIQVALTEPIRLDDVVIVEGEWGRIEEIGTTYVVVRIWDLRRLIVPLTYFIEKPFQNWTRVTADLLGTVYLYTDYTVPVESVRQKLHSVLESSGLWDGKVWGLQVTDTTERTMQLRALMSAPDSSAAWDLRCHVRERLIEFLQSEHPGSLPRARAEIRDAGETNPGSSTRRSRVET